MLAIIMAAAAIILTCKKPGDEVAVVIDNEKITIDEFNRYYYMFAKMMLNMDKKEVDRMAANPDIENHPTLGLLNRNKFMDFLISRKLLYKKAFDDDSLNKDDLKTIRELSDLQFVASYYLTQKLKDDIKVSEAEINEFYNQNRERLKGVPMNDEAISWMRNQVFMQKMEMKSNQFILDLLAEAKVNREGFKKYMKELEKKGESKEEQKEEEKKKEEKQEMKQEEKKSEKPQ